MTPWLAVIGVGEDGLAGLSPGARTLIDTAELVVGGERHLAMLPASGPERLAWASPLQATVAAIAGRRGRPVAVLASGDPMWFGVGVTLASTFPAEEMVILPQPSAFTLAAARLAWPLAAVETLTLHGRPLDLLALHLAPGARLLVLSADGATPAAVAAYLRERGWGLSALSVLERMGGPNERRIEGTAATWTPARVADLNTLAIECRPGPEAKILPRVPGLPDEAFAHDGQITKREVRAATLAALAPLPDQMLWDVGAGAGSIAIEWMRAARGARAVTIERERARLALIARNAAALGVPSLELVDGAAPEALAGLKAPDAVFIGGGLSAPGLIEACWSALRPGGRLVANAVTLEGEAALVEWHRKVGGSLTRIAVTRVEPRGEFQGWKPLAPVTQWCAVKP